MTITRAAAIVIFFCSAVAESSSWASEYSTDIEALNEVHKEIYLEARAILNSWSGGSEGREKLEKAGYMIDSMIASEPKFLPIYIEKARLTIMSGYTNDNYMAANREALKIIQDVQDKDPSYPKPYILAGHVYTNLGDYTNAERSLEAAKEIGTDDPWLYHNWAILLGIKGQSSEAVEYAEKALKLSGDNSKALLAAIDAINKYSRQSGGSGASRKIASIVFTHFNDPLDRLRIAERLIRGYRGNSANLARAHEIIMRQNEETPNLPEVALQFARLVLTNGYINTENHVARYIHEAGAQAERMLAQIAHEDSVRTRALELRVKIAIGAEELQKARRLIDRAADEGIIPQQKILSNLAYLHFAEGNYERSIALYERLGMTSHSILIAAYSMIGNVNKLHEYHKNKVAKTPHDAWTLGNYAGFLLFTLSDIDGAIEYGKRALAEMNYPMARENLGLAVLIRASKFFKSGNAAAARKDYEFARSIGLSGSYQMKHCGHYCFDIEEMIEIFREENG